jgi:hypothetical protein
MAHDRILAGGVDSARVIETAVSTYRAHAGLVIGLAASVLGLAAVLDLFVHAFVHDTIAERMSDVVAALLAGPLSVTSAALVLFAGVLDRLVGHHLFGHYKPTLRHTLRTLPWSRLLVADAGLMAAVAIGWALGAVPGLAMFTLWCLIAPVINIEGRSVFGSFSRSAQLVRRHFFLVFVLVTIPTVIESTVLHGWYFTDASRPWAATLIVGSALGVTAGAAIGLVEVVLAHLLISESDAILRGWGHGK